MDPCPRSLPRLPVSLLHQRLKAGLEALEPALGTGRALLGGGVTAALYTTILTPNLPAKHQLTRPYSPCPAPGGLGVEGQGFFLP